ncbi:MAG: hypothetical protein NT067_01525 [Candidatus Diapherotrites archaeon]|nr:hypothetical protein [Candidatus Diapherotrites archaeon]
MFEKAVGGAPRQENELRNDAVRAARLAVVGESRAGCMERKAVLKAREERIARGPRRVDPESRRILSFFEPNTFLQFGNGAKANVSLAIGPAIIGLALASGFGVRLFVKPMTGEFKTDEERVFKAKIDGVWLRGDDATYQSDLFGSIGFFGLYFPRMKGVNGRVAVLWIRQDRALPEAPKSIKKRFDKWDVELLSYLERRLKVAGVEKLLVATVDDPSGIGKLTRLEQYGKLGKRAERRGYHKETVEFKGDRRQYHVWPEYLVKNLQKPA